MTNNSEAERRSGSAGSAEESKSQFYLSTDEGDSIPVVVPFHLDSEFEAVSYTHLTLPTKA